MEIKKSEEAYKEALEYIPGGVNSPVRSLKSVGASPIFIDHAKGVQLIDIDGNCFTDFCLSWGVFILGHGHPQVNKAVINALSKGTSFGIPTLAETELAKLVRHCIPTMEKVRFVNSGTEAVMSAIRLARAYTGRNLVVKFEGCYHGHVDHLLVSAGSGVASLSRASSAGVPDAFVVHTVSLPFNDKKTIDDFFKERGSEVAAVIVEPVPANMGVVLPQGQFLHHLRKLTEKYNCLLIFDEVITGLRLSVGGAQQVYGVKPDITTIGKIIGGGFPAAAFGGKNAIMSLLAPDGPVYQAGTLSGNPVAMSAGTATLKILLTEGFYEDLNRKSDDFISELKNVVAEKGITVNHIGSMFTMFFTDEDVHSFADVKRTDRERFARFFRYMLINRVYMSPSPFEANFISLFHRESELERITKIVKRFNK